MRLPLTHKLLVGLILFLGIAGAQSPGDTAFQKAFQLDVPDTSGFSFATFTVPHGKRLMIRYLASSGTVPNGQRFWSSVQTTLLGSLADFPQLYATQDNGDGTDQAVSGQVVSIQADGDTTVYFQVFRRVAKGGIRVVFVVSGDLIPMP